MKNKFIVIIPARENSQRLVSKNSKLLNGKPLISYSIEYATKYFDANQIWVNTDDKKIITIAKDYNVNIYKRKKDLASNTAILSDVIFDQCNYLNNKNINYDNIILLQPTSPFREKFNLTEIIQVYINKKLNSLISVSKSKKKVGKISENIFLPLNYTFEQRSQSIKNYYYENGLFYIFNKSLLLKEKKIISNKVYPYIIEGIETKIDIDYEFDFIFAEMLLKNNLIN